MMVFFNWLYLGTIFIDSVHCTLHTAQHKRAKKKCFKWHILYALRKWHVRVFISSLSLERENNWCKQCFHIWTIERRKLQRYNVAYFERYLDVCYGLLDSNLLLFLEIEDTCLWRNRSTWIKWRKLTTTLIYIDIHLYFGSEFIGKIVKYYFKKRKFGSIFYFFWDWKYNY